MSVSQRLALIASLSLAVACSEPAAPVADDPPLSLELVAAPFLPGEQQPTAALTRNPLAIYPMGAGQNLAQVFRPTTTQSLGYLELPVGCAAGVLLNVKIRRGLDGPILYEVNVAGLPQVVDGSFQLIQVYNPAVHGRGILLEGGRSYSFHLAAFPGPGALARTCGIPQGPAGDSYSRGRGFYRDPINGPSFLPLPNGAPTDNEDLPFRTLVR